MHTSNIKKMYAFNFCINLHFIGGVLVPFFTDWGRLNYTQIMLLQAWFSICLFLLEIPTGAVADRFGRKVSLLLGVCTLGIAVCIYGSIPSFAVFMLGEFLFATAMALMSGADEALLYDSLVGEGQEKQAKTILGRFISASRLAMMLSAPLGSLIAKYLGLQETMRLIVIPCFLAFILAALLYEPEYRKPEEKESLSYTQTLVRGATGLVKNRILRIMALDAVPVSVLIFYLIWLYQPLLQYLQLDIGYFGFVHAAVAGSQVIVLLVYHRIEQLLGTKKKYLLFTALVSGIGFIGIGLLPSVALVITITLLVSGFGLSRIDVMRNYMQAHIPSAERATVLSSLGMVRRLGMAVLNPIIGLCMDASLQGTAVGIGMVIILLAGMSRVQEEWLVG